MFGNLSLLSVSNFTTVALCYSKKTRPKKKENKINYYHYCLTNHFLDDGP